MNEQNNVNYIKCVLKLEYSLSDVELDIDYYEMQKKPYKICIGEKLVVSSSCDHFLFGL